jgi:hypothetical protein
VSKLRVVEGEGDNRLSQASAIVKSAAIWSCVGAMHGTRLESHCVVVVLVLVAGDELKYIVSTATSSKRSVH